MFNEWYAKDTSKKIRAVMKVKGNAGEHLTTLPPYGYMKSPDNKKLWVRDEEAAAVFAPRFAVLFGSSMFVFLLVESGRNEKRENDRCYRHSPMKTTMRL